MCLKYKERRPVVAVALNSSQTENQNANERSLPERREEKKDRQIEIHIFEGTVYECLCVCIRHIHWLLCINERTIERNNKNKNKSKSKHILRRVEAVTI